MLYYDILYINMFIIYAINIHFVKKYIFFDLINSFYSIYEIMFVNINNNFMLTIKIYELILLFKFNEYTYS